MASRNAEGISLLNGELRPDAVAGQKTRASVLLGVASVAALALAGVHHAGGAPSLITSSSPRLGLPGDDGTGRPTLYAMLDQQGLSEQLKHLQCYKKMATDANMQLAVGEYTSGNFQDSIFLDDVVQKDDNAGWRTMSKGDWQRIEDAGGPDLCISAADKTDTVRADAKYSFPGGQITSVPSDVITNYDDVLNELKTREWWTCLGSQQFAICADTESQIDFKPSPHITEVMQIARKSLFGKSPIFKAVHLDAGATNFDAKINAFRDVCKEAKAGMGPPVYVATDDASQKTHAKLHKMGCVTSQNITGYDMLQDWELRAMDQFLMADAETHVTTSCSAMDSVAAASRTKREKSHSRVYVAASDSFVDFPNEQGEASCVKSVSSLETATDTHKESEKAFTDKVKDAAALVEAAMKQEAEAARARGEVVDGDVSESPDTAGNGDVPEPGLSEGELPVGVPGEQPVGVEGERPLLVEGRPVQKEPTQPLPASAEDRVTAIETDVHGLKEGMNNIMSTLFNIQQSLVGNPDATAATAAAKEAAQATETTAQSVARIVAEAKVARAAVDAAKSTAEIKAASSAGAKTDAKTNAKTNAKADAKAASKLDKRVAAAAKAAGVVSAADAAKAPVEDLESYETQMMG
jgi:hypothetical protein